MNFPDFFFLSTLSSVIWYICNAQLVLKHILFLFISNTNVGPVSRWEQLCKMCRVAEDCGVCELHEYGSACL